MIKVSISFKLQNVASMAFIKDFLEMGISSITKLEGKWP